MPLDFVFVLASTLLQGYHGDTATAAVQSLQAAANSSDIYNFHYCQMEENKYPPFTHIFTYVHHYIFPSNPTAIQREMLQFLLHRMYLLLQIQINNTEYN